MLDQATLMLLTSKNINALRNSGLLGFYCISREYSGEGGGGGVIEKREIGKILEYCIIFIQFCNLTKEHKTQKLLRKGWNLRVDVMVSRKTVQYPCPQ